MTHFRSIALGANLIFALNVPAQQTITAISSAERSVQLATPASEDVPRVDEQLRVLTDKLDLTEHQQARIKPFLQRVHDSTAKILQDQSLSHEQRLARVRPIRHKAHEEIQEVLNFKQRKKLERYMQGPHPEMHGSLSGARSSQSQRE